MFEVRQPRNSSTEVIHKIWDSIESINRNSSLGKKAIKAIQRVPCPTEVLTVLETTHNVGRGVAESELFFAVGDHLVALERNEAEDMMYIRLPSETEEKPSHDYYCFHCHLGRGPMLGCVNCHRVYHPPCAAGYSSEKEWTKSRCPACVAVYSSKRPPDLSIKKLNAVLKLAMDRAWNKNYSVLNSCKSNIWTVASERSIRNDWRYELLIWRGIDLEEIRSKASKEEYRTPEEFNLDCETLLHNIVVFFGKAELLENSLPSAAFAFFRTAVLHSLEELRICPDCFQRSFCKNLPFTLPCSKPHGILWVQKADRNYWPAKIMQKQGTQFDVAFFGGKHSREWVPEGQTKKETVLIHSKNPLLQEALQELKQFQNLQKIPGTEPLKMSAQSSKRGKSLAEEINSAKRRKEIQPELPEIQQIPELPEVQDAEEELYEVEEVHGSKVRHGVQYYWIKWKNYPKEENTWEPEHNLACPDLLEAYHQAQKSKAKSKAKVAKTRKTVPASAKQSSEEEWEVEEILDCKTKKGKKYYLISWKGFPSEDNTWEAESHLNCSDLLKKFKLEQLQKQKQKQIQLQNVHKTESRVAVPFRKSTRFQKTPKVEPKNALVLRKSCKKSRKVVSMSDFVQVLIEEQNPCADLIDRNLDLLLETDSTEPEPVEAEPLEERRSNEDPEEEVESEENFQKKVNNWFGGPFYADGSNVPMYLCLYCQGMFEGEFNVKCHIIDVHKDQLDQ